MFKSVLAAAAFAAVSFAIPSAGQAAPVGQIGHAAAAGAGTSIELAWHRPGHRPGYRRYYRGPRCRTIVNRRVNPYTGNVVVTRRRVCR